jgi:hypothetical protein
MRSDLFYYARQMSKFVRYGSKAGAAALMIEVMAMQTVERPQYIG